MFSSITIHISKTTEHFAFNIFIKFVTAISAFFDISRISFSALETITPLPI
jgi:hypothetical protein